MTDFKLVVGGTYTQPGSFTEMNMQLGDDPLFNVTATHDPPGLNQLTLRWSTGDPSYIPQAYSMIELWEREGQEWIKRDEFALAASGEVVLNVPEGTNHPCFFRIKTVLSPADKVSDSNMMDLWTDYMLEVIEAKDAGGTTLEGALILAVPAEQLLALVSPTAEGQDWPTLAYRRCNRVDEFGRCSIRVPGGYGGAAVLMIPDAYPTKGGDILAPVETQEES